MILSKLSELQENTENKLTKSGNQYMNKIRSLTEIKNHFKKKQTEILELNNSEI